MNDTNLKISEKIIELERDLLGKVSLASKKGMEIYSTGVEHDDFSKLKEGTLLLLISKHAIYVSNYCGKYNNTFFIQSIIKDRSIDNDLLNETVNDLVDMNKKELIHFLDNSLEHALDIISIPLGLSEDSQKIALDYCQSLRDFKSFIDEN